MSEGRWVPDRWHTGQEEPPATKVTSRISRRMDDQNPKRIDPRSGIAFSDERAIRRRRKLKEAAEFWNMSVAGVWLHYVSLGGDLTEYELDAYLHEAYFLTPYQHDILAEAVNELIDMLPPPPRAPLTDETGL